VPRCTARSAVLVLPRRRGPLAAGVPAPASLRRHEAGASATTTPFAGDGKSLAVASHARRLGAAKPGPAASRSGAGRACLGSRVLGERHLTLSGATCPNASLVGVGDCAPRAVILAPPSVVHRAAGESRRLYRESCAIVLPTIGAVDRGRRRAGARRSPRIQRASRRWGISFSASCVGRLRNAAELLRVSRYVASGVLVGYAARALRQGLRRRFGLTPGSSGWGALGAARRLELGDMAVARQRRLATCCLRLGAFSATTVDERSSLNDSRFPAWSDDCATTSRRVSELHYVSPAFSTAQTSQARTAVRCRQQCAPPRRR